MVRSPPLTRGVVSTSTNDGQSAPADPRGEKETYFIVLEYLNNAFRYKNNEYSEKVLKKLRKS